MHRWLVKNGWIADFSGKPVSQVFSYIGFVGILGVIEVFVGSYLSFLGILGKAEALLFVGVIVSVTIILGLLVPLLIAIIKWILRRST